jgi:hypothetical protein
VYVEVLGVVDVFVGASLDSIDDLRCVQHGLEVVVAGAHTLGSRSIRMARGM